MAEPVPTPIILTPFAPIVADTQNNRHAPIDPNARLEAKYIPQADQLEFDSTQTIAQKLAADKSANTAAINAANANNQLRSEKNQAGGYVGLDANGGIVVQTAQADEATFDLLQSNAITTTSINATSAETFTLVVRTATTFAGNRAAVDGGGNGRFNSVEANVITIGGSPVERIENKNMASGYVGLDSNGKIDPFFLPPLGITSIQVVANQGARRALTNVQEGDAVKEADSGRTFLLSTGSPTLEANWVQISDISPEIANVNGLQTALDAKQPKFAPQSATALTTNQAAIPTLTAGGNAYRLGAPDLFVIVQANGKNYGIPLFELNT